MHPVFRKLAMGDDAAWKLPLPPDAEWLEPDGRGGFASGTVAGARTRRYHGLLLAAPDPPAGRLVLVNGLEAWLEMPDGTRLPLSTQYYDGDVTHPRGCDAVADFRPDPWPRWVYRFGNDVLVEQEIVVIKDSAVTLITWRLISAGNSAVALRLGVRPLLSGRDYHCLHRENPSFDFRSHSRPGGMVTWQPYASLPAILAWSSGDWRDEPQWYRNFLYRQERERGLDFLEDLASPGTFSWTLTAEKNLASLALSAQGCSAPGSPTPFALPAGQDAGPFVRTLQAVEGKRRSTLAAGRFFRAADAYLIRPSTGPTVVAGYPWFTDWGRDTFIAMRGLYLASGRLREAGQILLRWAGAVSEGMLPNRFPDQGGHAEFNSVDASLWFVITAREFLNAAAASGLPVPAEDTQRIGETIDAILSGYADGTRYGIWLDPADGLLRSGVGAPGIALTWMDAVVDGRPVTPRAGKAVEIQCLWLNALHLAGASERSSRWRPLFEKGLVSLHAKFWMDAVDKRYLRDVVDCDGRPGVADERFRPNQIFAVGGLPLCVLPADAAYDVVAEVEKRLLTPLGLRTLAPGERDYAPRYEGGPSTRDSRYHQGTVWPWLLGPFVEAWVRVRGSTPKAKAEARARFLNPLLSHVNDLGIGHLPEIADADPPHAPKGCPFQAWSLGEAMRLDRVVLA